MKDWRISRFKNDFSPNRKQGTWNHKTFSPQTHIPDCRAAPKGYGPTTKRNRETTRFIAG